MALELNGFYNMDCMEGMKQFPDKYFELAIMDPPYGISINSNMGRRKGDRHSNYKKVRWDSAPPEMIIFENSLGFLGIRLSGAAITFACLLQNVSSFGESLKYAKTFHFLWSSSHGRISTGPRRSGLA